MVKRIESAVDKEIIRRVSHNKGGSMSVVIPPKLAEEVGIDGGDYVIMETSYLSGENKGKVILIKKLIVTK